MVVKENEFFEDEKDQDKMGGANKFNDSEKNLL